MRRVRFIHSAVWIFVLLLTVGVVPTRVLGQGSVGSIEGKITDSQGAVVPGATVTAKSKRTNAEREQTTKSDGSFQILSLPPGDYEVSVVAQGFKRAVKDSVNVAVGKSVGLDVSLEVGAVGETVEVTSGEAQIDRTDQTVDGVVNTMQIATLPLNGRNFLDLARLEPGSETVDGGGFDPTKANYTGVSIGGAAGRSTQISIDGGSVVDNVVGTTVQNFSQEVVEEFQVGVANQDVASGASSTGVVNVITRSGSNDFHGNAYIYFRNDSLAAYPGLARLDDTDTSDLTVPFTAESIPFDREQFGGSIGGPLYKDKAFFFFNTEYNNQDGASIFNIPDGRIIGFNGTGAQPFNELLLTTRVDWKLNDNNSLFGRYSHDDNDQLQPFAPNTGITPKDSASGIFSSNNQFNTNRADGFVIGLTSVIGAAVVNDFRYSYLNFKNDIQPDPAAVPGSPEIRVIDPDQTWKSGTNYITPQVTTQVRNQIRDDISWTHGNHVFRFGINYERTAIGGQFAFAKPARIRLYGPGFGGPPILQTEADFLNCPVRDISMGVGQDLLPFDNPNGATINNRIDPYFNDSWKITPRFTLNYGIGYRYDSNLWNVKYGRPQIIAPLFNDGTAAPSNDLNNWAPRVGFAWDLSGDGKTVIRGGFGWYYDNTIDNLRLFETADVIAPGSELFLVGTDIQSSILPGGDGRFGSTPTSSTGYLTLGQALALIGPTRADLESRTFDTTAPTSIQATNSVSGPLFATDFQLPYSLQYAIGFQRELGYDFVIQADYNYRKSNHEVIVYDANFASAVDKDGNSLAIIPEFGNDGVPNSVTYANSGAYSVYKALLVRLDKRFSNNWQVTASYTNSVYKAFGGDTLGLGEAPTNQFQLDQDYGYAGLDRRQRFVVSALWDLPKYGGDNKFARGALNGWQISTISQWFSGLPYSVFLPDSVDLYGSGTFTSYLPGTGQGSIGRDIKSVGDLNAAISAYNANINSYAARFVDGQPVDPQGTPLRQLALVPDNTPIGGDSVISQDFRFTKKFYFNETMHFDIIAEVFNIFNVANLRDVTNTTLDAQEDVDSFVNSPENYGHLPYPFTILQPTVRQNSVFGSGGPRAWQFALKFTF